MVSKVKKVIALYLDEKCVNSNQELLSGSFDDGFHHFGLFSAASVATPVILNQMYGSFYKCWWAAENALAGRSLPDPGIDVQHAK